MINSATTVLSVVVGDQNYDLHFTVQDFEGVIVNLLDATIVFKAQLISDHDVQFSGPMVVDSSIDGTCQYTVQATDFPVAGVYQAQIVVSYPSTNKQITFDNIQITAIYRVPQ